MRVIKLLFFQSCVDVNNRSFKTDGTALHEAIIQRHVEVALLLIAREEIRVSQYGNELYSMAIISGLPTIMQLLLDKEDCANSPKNSEYPFLLKIAIEQNKGNTVRQLLSRRSIDVNWVDDEEKAALFKVVWCRNASIVEILLSHADIIVNGRDRAGATPLLRAVENEDITVVELLQSHGGVDINAKANYGRTAWSEAVFHGSKDILNLLLARDHSIFDADNSDGSYLLTEIIEWVRDYPESSVHRRFYLRSPLDLRPEEGVKAALEFLQAAVEDKARREREKRSQGVPVEQVS